MKLRDRHWLAGLLEGEGCFTLAKGRPRIDVAMTDRDVVERVARLIGAPSVRERSQRSSLHSKTYVTVSTGAPAAAAMVEIEDLMGDRRRRKIREVLDAWRQ